MAYPKEPLQGGSAVEQLGCLRRNHEHILASRIRRTVRVCLDRALAVCSGIDQPGGDHKVIYLAEDVATDTSPAYAGATINNAQSRH
jgi:hypothetical protein